MISELKEEWVLVFFLTVIPALLTIPLVARIVRKEKIFTKFYYHLLYFSIGFSLFFLWLGSDPADSIIIALMAGWIVSIIIKLFKKLFRKKERLEKDSQKNLEFQKENNNSRKYVAYFFCGWLFFSALMFGLFKWATITTDLTWGLILYILVPIFLALFITPLITLAIRSEKTHAFAVRIEAYFRRLLFPVYLFPIKLVTYSTYYLIKFIVGLIISLLKIIRDFIVFPFRSIKNLLKSFFIVALVAYIAVSFFVNFDYLNTHYGWYEKFFICGMNRSGVNKKLKNSVVRIVGGYSEGTGFFIKPNEIVTNFHVIDGEPSPKIIFPDGSFIVPKSIVGNKDMDLAIIFTEKNYPEMKLETAFHKIELYANEPLIATGYALGTDLTGSATQLEGNFMDYRTMRYPPYGYIQTNISLVPGMSGGSLADQCGLVLGINTITVGGISLFIPFDIFPNMEEFSDEDIKKIQVNPAASPQEAVKAFYTYLKARKMKEGFGLLSEKYLLSTNFEEWNNRFSDVIDVDVISTEKYEKTADTVFVKFITKNWVNNDVEMHYYGGTWKTILEDDVYKMLKSNIKEVLDPDEMWFYE